MFRRLLLGLVIGAVVGIAIAAVLVAGLKIAVFTGPFGALLAYAGAAGTGAVTGLVAGKPIWAGDAKVEGGLKAVFGSLLAVAGMFALRRWAPGVDLDLTALHGGGPAHLADLPAASLPLIAAVLGMFFELDNSVPDAAPDGRRRVAAGGSASASTSRSSSSSNRVRAEDAGGPGEEQEEESSGVSRRARR
jgi:hypothetical protein